MMRSETKPDFVSLDVRPILAEGEEPFTTIMAAAGTVAESGVLEIIAPFEPVPLYQVLSRRGFAQAMERRGPAEFVVRFTHTGIEATSTVGEVYRRYPSTAPVLAEHGLDLCCGGDRTLEFAAGAHGVELVTLLAELQQAALAGSA